MTAEQKVKSAQGTVSIVIYSKTPSRQESNKGWIKMSLLVPSEKLYLYTQDLKIAYDFLKIFSQAFRHFLNLFFL